MLTLASDHIEVFDPQDKGVTGVAFAVHGLNQNPRSFHQYLKDLARHGIRSYLLHLPGHRAEKSISSNLIKVEVALSLSGAGAKKPLILSLK